MKTDKTNCPKCGFEITGSQCENWDCPDRSGLYDKSGLDELDFMDKLNKCHLSDCVDFMNSLPPKSVQLIIMDKPYFEIKGDFDFIWPTHEAYLEDCDKWAKAAKRILADNGSLYVFGHAKNIAYDQVVFDRYFTLLSAPVWEVEDRQTKKNEPSQMRTFIPITERILFYSNDYEPGEWQMTGWERVIEEKIKPRHPMALYLTEEFKRAGVTRKEIAALFPSKNGNLTGCVSNWLNGDNFITEPQYNTIREYLNGEFLRTEYEFLRTEYEELRTEYEFLRTEYEELRTEYEELRTEYEELRRPFNGKPGLFDVLRISQESHKTRKWPHPTPKPPTLIRTIIEASSRPGDIVFSPFSGSGVDAEQAIKLKRQWVACDLDQKCVDMTNKRAQQATNGYVPNKLEDLQPGDQIGFFDHSEAGGWEV